MSCSVWDEAGKCYLSLLRTQSAKRSLIGYDLFGHLKVKLSSPFGLVRVATTFLAMSLLVRQRPAIFIAIFPSRQG